MEFLNKISLTRTDNIVDDICDKIDMIKFDDNYYAELAMKMDMIPVSSQTHPDIFTVPEPNNDLPKIVYDWINKHVQLKHLSVAYKKQGLDWNCTVKGSDYFHCISTTATETTKRVALLAAGVFFKSQLVYADSSAFDDEQSTKVTLHGDCFKLKGEVSTKTFGDMDSGTAEASGVETLSEDPAQNTTLTTISGENRDTSVGITMNRYVGFLDGGEVSFPHLVDRYVHVSNIDWNTSMAYDTIIGSFDMPIAALIADKCTPNVIPFGQYTYSRPYMTHTLLSNATEFHSGTLIMAIRYNNRADSGPIISKAAQLFAMPHIIIQACSANTGCLEVPFMHPLPWCPNIDTGVGEGAYYHTVYLGVVNGLGIGTGGSTTVTLQLYSKFSTEENQTSFAMLRNTLAVGTGVSPCDVASFEPVVSSFKVGDGPALSVAVSGAKTVGNVASAVERAATGIGSVFKSNNQDRPVVQHDTGMAVITAAPNMPLGSGAIDLVSMRLNKDALCPFVPSYIPVKDSEYSFDFLKKVKGVINSFNWTTQDTRGKNLFYWPVTPISGLRYDNQILFTTLSEIASNFTFFSGTLTLEFLFGSSLKHSGRLLIVFSPDDSVTPSLETAYALPYVIFDLRTQQIVQFRVPLSCPTHLAPIFSTDTSGAILGPFVYGGVYVFVETPLKILNSVSGTIECTVLLNASDDVNFYVPRPNLLAYAPVSPQTFGDIDSHRVEREQVLTSYKPVSMAEHTIGENINLFDASRRMVPYYTTQFISSDAANDRQISFNVFFGAATPRDPNQRFDIVTQMQDGFRFAKGSITYYIVATTPRFTVKHIPKTDNLIVTPNFTDMDMSVNNFDTGYATQQVIGSVNKSVTITIPYYNQHNFLTNSYLPDYSDLYWGVARYMNGCLQVTLQDLLPSTKYRLDIYRALGDDAEMYVFQGFPMRSNLSLGGNFANIVPVLRNIPSTRIIVGPTPSYGSRASSAVVVSLVNQTSTINYTITSGNFTRAVIGNVEVLNYIDKLSGVSTTTQIDVNIGPPYCLKIACVDADTYTTGSVVSMVDTAPNTANFEYLYLPSTSIVGRYWYLDVTDAAGVTRTYKNVQANNKAQTIPFQYFIGGQIYIRYQDSSSITTAMDYYKMFDREVNIPECPRPVVPAYDTTPDAPNDLTPPVIPQESPSFFEDASQKPVDLSTVWREARKVVGLPRKPHFRDVTLVHARNKSIALSRMALQALLFTEETKVGDIDLLGIASSGANLVSGNVMGVVNSAITGFAAMRGLNSAERTMESVRTTMETATGVIGQIPTLLSNGAGTVVETVSTIGQLIITSISERFLGAVPDIIAKLSSIAIHLYTLTSSSDTSVRIAAFLGILTNLGAMTVGMIGAAWGLIKSIFTTTAWNMAVDLNPALDYVPSNSFPAPPSWHFNRLMNADAPEDEQETDYKITMWLKFLIPGLVALCGVKGDFTKKGILAFKDAFVNAVKLSNDMSRFIHFNMEFIRDFFYWLIGEARPEIPASLMLSDKIEEMTRWVDEVLKITQGHMRDRVAASTGLQKHLDLLYQEGTKYLTMYRQANKDTTAFLSVFRKLSDLHSSVGQRVGRGRLVNEPVTFWVFGPPGVGKSNVASKLLTDTLISFGVVYDGPAVYVRNFTDFWNGWADQPAVLWDDWGQNQSETVFAQTISEYFSITSIAEFNANMPAIEDKDRMVNPYVTGICSNEAIINTNLVLCPDALKRRRDFLIHVDFAPHYKCLNPPVRSASDARITNEDLETYNHIRFTLCNKYEGVPIAPELSNLTYAELYSVIIPQALRLRDRLANASRARSRHQNTLSPAAWQERLNNNLVPEPFIESIARAVNMDPRNLTLSQVIDNNNVPDCDYCIDTGDDVYPLPHAYPLESPYDEDLPPPGYFEGCICHLLADHAMFCEKKLAYYLPRECVPWLTPPEYEGNGNYTPWPAPEDVFIKLWSPCSDMCVERICPQHNFPDGEIVLTPTCIKDRWNRFVGGWQRRYRDTIPIIGETSVSLYVASLDAAEFHEDIKPPTSDQIIAFRQDPTQPLVNPGARTERRQRRFAWLSERLRDHNVTFVNLLLMLGTGFVIMCLTWSVYLIILKVVDFLFPNINVFTYCGLVVLTRALFRRSIAIALMDYVMDIASSGDVRTAPRAMPNVHISMPNAPNDPTPSVSIVKGKPDDPMVRKIQRNTMIIEAVCPSDPNLRFSSQIFAISGRKALMPFHYTSFFSDWQKKGYHFTLHTWPTPGNISSFKIDIDYLEPRRLLKYDMCLIKLPSCVPPVPSVVGVFSDQRNAAGLFDKRATLISGHDSSNGYDSTIREFEGVEFCKGDTQYAGGTQVTLLGYKYPFSKAGACMSVLLDPKTQHILGFHTTGDKDRSFGYATICTREMVAPLICDLVPEDIPKRDPESSSMLDVLKHEDISVMPVAKVSKKMSLHTNTKTQIRLTPMAGLLSEPSRFPAQLSEPGEENPGYIPLARAVGKGFVDTTPFPKQFVDIAADDLCEEIVVKCKPLTKDPQVAYNNEQAIVGLPGVPFCEGLKLGTSPGWPLCSLSPGAHKSTFIKTNEERSFVEIKPILASYIDKEERLRREGVIPFSVYADFGKDERLKPGKQMRLINGCPLQQTIIWRKYCMEFFAAFQHAQLSIGSAIGINPFGLGMNDMAQHLLEVGGNILTGDYKNFGPTLHAECVDKISYIMDRWYEKHVPGGEDEVASRVRHSLIASLINSYHIAGDLIYQTYQGAPSGNPYTAPVNTLVALMYLRIVWQGVFKKTAYAGMAAFHKYFRFICYGDDFIGSIHSDFLPYFNNISMQQFFQKYGLVFTEPTKTGEMRLSCSLQEASFLKCTFARHVIRDIYVAHLDLSVVLDIVNWCRLPVPDMMSHLFDLADQTLRFLALYGPDVYNEKASKLKQWFAERGKFFPVSDWSIVDQVFDGERTADWIDKWW